MKSDKTCCIIIPTYKTYDRLSMIEKKYLENNIKVLNDYPIIILCPDNLNTNSYNNLEINSFLKFDASFFKNVNCYNDLMLSTAFYEQLKEYDYMLLVQLDAYVFKNDLEYFLGLGYDYIGNLHKIPHVKDKMINGNGGFSLRKIDSFINASKTIKKDLNGIKDWEDIMYSYWYKDKMNIAPDEISLKFGWQQNPNKCYEMNGNKLPFGCHKPHIFGKDFESYQIIFK